MFICFVLCFCRGIDFDENEDDSNNDGDNTTQSIQELCLAAQIKGKSMGLDPVKAENRAVMEHIVKRLNKGVIFPARQALKMLRFIRTPRVLQRTVFRGVFEIADGLGIPVYVYKKCHHVTLPTLQKGIAGTDEGTQFQFAERKTTYRLRSDMSKEVAGERTIKGFRYGRSVIPESSIDAESMRPQTEKCLVLIGFTEARRVPHHMFMGETELVVPAPADAPAKDAFTALVVAMEELNRYAVCRYVQRKSAQPTLVALIPRKFNISS